MEQAPQRTGAVRVLVSGRVQGVGFRDFVRREAERLGLGGWVRNLPDGRVEAWAEGPTDRLEQFTGALGRGPAGARVDRIEVEGQPVPAARPGSPPRRGFEIRYF